ncbi:DUF6431 domain-containing protein [Paenibacillus sp. 79R4]|uniref:DUF6431 domain-containing protein n=1 Tax=unclassified Paenibacillus TaxID=185978 RepID=UPI00356A7EFA
MHKHCRYWREVATKKEVARIPVYRWYCPDCKITFSLLPDFLVPWARHTTWVRESAITANTRGSPGGRPR